MTLNNPYLEDDPTPDEMARPVHCLASDNKCTCPCGKGLRPEFSELRDKRGRICADCQAAEEQDRAQKQYEWEQENCICSWNDLSGRSVCGLPCPVHSTKK